MSDAVKGEFVILASGGQMMNYTGESLGALEGGLRGSGGAGGGASAYAALEGGGVGV